MGSEELSGSEDRDPDPSATTRFGKHKFILNPRECVLVEFVDGKVRDVASVGADGVEKAWAVSTSAATGLGRKIVGAEAQPAEAAAGETEPLN